MKITAIDIHQKEFAHGMRGYREDEVDAFLDQVAVEVDAAERRSKELEDQVAALEARNISFESERNTINNTLLSAQRAADDLLVKARMECDRMLAAAQVESEVKMENAQRQAQDFVDNTKRKHQQLVGNIARLKGVEEKFRAAYLKQLDAFFTSVPQIEVEARRALQEIPLPDDLMEELRAQSDAISRLQSETSARPAVIGPTEATDYSAPGFASAPESVLPASLGLDLSALDTPQPADVLAVSALPEAGGAEAPIEAAGGEVAPVAPAVEMPPAEPLVEAPSDELSLEAPVAQMPVALDEPAPAPVVDEPTTEMPALAVAPLPVETPVVPIGGLEDEEDTAFAQWGDREDDLDIEEID